MDGYPKESVGCVDGSQPWPGRVHSGREPVGEQASQLPGAALGTAGADSDTSQTGYTDMKKKKLFQSYKIRF